VKYIETTHTNVPPWGMDGELLTVEEAAAMLKLTPESVRRMLRLRQLPGVKLGLRQWRVPAAELQKFIEKGMTGEAK
jgi:excisionase family DNA binding protein